MNVNQLMARLRTLQKQGYGKTEVHMIAHDNIPGETQGVVSSVSHFKKDADEANDFAGRDVNLYASIPDEVIYLHS